MWVSEAVKRRATVLLTGDGGDDVFLGYPFFHNAWLADRLLPDHNRDHALSGDWSGSLCNSETRGAKSS
jgi:asparagine synthetase B (glutamine-hydrolysing)